ncbi:MAG: NAD(P)-dependent oxidoreductase [Methanomassiliicoccales archaeon]|nr:NAD(P)-dependent oxidoreductase [Methanomassiliicoccales archaeon]
MPEVPNSQLSSVVKEDIGNIVAKCQKEIGSLNGSTVLITGSTGFLARELTESLLLSIKNGQNIKLVLISREPVKVKEVFGGRLAPDVDIVPMDEMEHYPHRVDYIIHAASPCDPRVNNASPLRTMTDICTLMQKAVSLGQKNQLKKFIFISSGAVYGVQPPELKRIPEDYPGAPDINRMDSCYGEAKRCAELMLLSSGIPYTILRGFSFIGPNQDLTSSFAVPDFLTCGFRDKRITISGDGRPVRAFCYESDFAIMLLKCLVRAKNQTLNAGNDGPEVSIKKLADMVAKAIGGVDVIIKGRDDATKLPPRYVPDVDRMRNVFVPEVGVEQAIGKVVRHIRETTSQHSV